MRGQTVMEVAFGMITFMQYDKEETVDHTLREPTVLLTGRV